MTYIGTVSKGKVILPPEAKLPEGAKVQVTPVRTFAKTGRAGKWLLQFAGVVRDLPPDFAERHDHYIHGARKR